MMRYLSVCSGIEAASVAWRPLDWKAAGFAEIDKFPCRVLAHHYPDVPNHGDFTTINVSRLGSIDLLVGGTPCQAFSIAGKRLSLTDARGNLSLAYTVLAHELARSNGLRWAVWENVPGVLSTDDNAFGCFLGSLVGSDDAIPLPRGAERWPDAGMVAGPRARAAWRILDAQYFGLAQRRRRVFVVAGFGDRADPAQVLFERKGLRGDSPPRRETRQGVTHSVAPSLTSSGRGVERGGDTRGQDPVVAVAFGTALPRTPFGTQLAPKAFACFDDNRTSGPRDVAASLDVTHSLRADGFDAGEDGTGRGTPLVPICFSAKDHGADAQVDLSPTLRAGGFTESHANAGVMPAVAFVQNSRSEVRLFGEDGQTAGAVAAEPGAQQQTYIAQAFDMRGREGGAQFEGPHDTANIRASNGGSSRSYVAQQWAVRRLTPTECARLQGFPDDYLALTGAADGPQYKALGNSFAVPVVRWIGERIAAQDASLKQAEAA